jgi:hypothetical protein
MLFEFAKANSYRSAYTDENEFVKIACPPYKTLEGGKTCFPSVYLPIGINNSKH